jgi:hypothetical protein
MRMQLGCILAVTLALVATRSEARVACNTRDQVVKALGEQFDEVPVANGVTQGGQLMEVFASTQGTWTLILSLPTGQSCLVANGDEWDNSTGDAATRGPALQGPREGIALQTPGEMRRR